MAPQGPRASPFSSDYESGVQLTGARSALHQLAAQGTLLFEHADEESAAGSNLGSSCEGVINMPWNDLCALIHATDASIGVLDLQSALTEAGVKRSCDGAYAWGVTHETPVDRAARMITNTPRKLF